ncbi:NCBP3-like protein [Mya arenaria]|uniref:NCBP3-like protein n=1 Tax=Mya arenaria TaxID=6604 RepID=A0ABY7E110_MYAAR|nr:NCBP3-like protein [Mya arenaria]
MPSYSKLKLLPSSSTRHQPGPSPDGQSGPVVIPPLSPPGRPGSDGPTPPASWCQLRSIVCLLAVGRDREGGEGGVELACLSAPRPYRDSQIDIDDTESDKRILIPANAETSPPSSPFQQHAVDKKDDVQFNVYLNKLDPPQTEKPTIRPTRVYENKSGDFVTGIDFRVESSVERMQERAKRFGIDFIPEPAVDLETLYDSLGLKPDDVKLKDERGMRLDAIHIRGVTEMNTKDATLSGWIR